MVRAGTPPDRAVCHRASTGARGGARRVWDVGARCARQHPPDRARLPPRLGGSRSPDAQPHRTNSTRFASSSTTRMGVGIDAPRLVVRAARPSAVVRLASGHTLTVSDAGSAVSVAKSSCLPDGVSARTRRQARRGGHATTEVGGSSEVAPSALLRDERPASPQRSMGSGIAGASGVACQRKSHTAAPPAMVPVRSSTDPHWRASGKSSAHHVFTHTSDKS